MYKQRMNDWDIKKNGRHALYKAALDIGRRHVDAGLTPPATINGQQVHWDRVVRHFKHDPRYKTSCLDKLAIGSRQDSTPFCHSFLQPLISKPSDSASDGAERGLHQIKDYFRECLMADRRHCLDDLPARPNQALPFVLWESLLGGMSLISRGESQQWYTLINNACALAPDVLKAQGVDLVSDLIHVLSLEEWTNMSPLHSLIVGYLANLSKTLLGQEHAFSRILEIFESQIASTTYGGTPLASVDRRDRSIPCQWKHLDSPLEARGQTGQSTHVEEELVDRNSTL